MSDAVLVVDAEAGRVGGEQRPVVAVAVGILIDAKDRFLLTSRPEGKAYAGYWEFPGGKLEAGESVEQALRRELQEEIGVTIGEAPLWREQLVDYPHALVHLYFCQVRDWVGTIEMRESQLHRWEDLPVGCAPILPGTVPVLAWLADEQQR